MMMVLSCQNATFLIVDGKFYDADDVDFYVTVPSVGFADDNNDNDFADDNDVIAPSLAVVFPGVHFVGQRWRGRDGKSTTTAILITSSTRSLISEENPAKQWGERAGS